MAHSTERSDFFDLLKHNGDFRKHYGLIIGAYLYALSLRTICGRPFPWLSTFLAVFAASVGWLAMHR